MQFFGETHLNFVGTRRTAFIVSVTLILAGLVSLAIKGGPDLSIDFGADCMESWLSPTEHARQIMQARDVAEHPNGGARLVYVGPRLSMTAGSADEWLPAKPGSEGILALAIARVAFDRARAAGQKARQSVG